MLWLFLIIFFTASNVIAQPSGGFSVIGSVSQIQIACSEDEILKFSSSVWACAADNAAAGSGAILDLGDDASNESTSIGEIATTGDTNSVFTEPSADKLLINLGNNWPSADTADALSANGANCNAGEFPLGVNASGAVETCTDAATQTELNTHISDITDVHGINTVTPADGHILVYDGVTDNRFENVAVSGDVTISAAGVATVGDDSHNHSSLSDSDGTVTLSGTGGTNNESLTLDFETTANAIIGTSTTSASVLNLGAFTVQSNQLESTANTTDGGAVTLCEDTDIGTDCVALSVGQTNLPAGTTTHTFDTNGRIPASAVGDGVDEVIAMFYHCQNLSAGGTTRYLVIRDNNGQACKGNELSWGGDAEAHAELPYNGFVNALSCRMETAPGAGQSITLTARFEGASTDCSVVISDTAAQGVDTTCSTAYTANDRITVQIVASASAADSNFLHCTILMEQTL